METLAPRNPRTRHNSRPTPPELHLLGTPKSLPSQVSSTTSLSSINSLPSQHQHQQQQQHGQAHPRQQLPSHNHDLQSRGNTAGSSTQLQTYGAHYPSYRPYTPTTPTTPTALHALTMSMPATPTLAAMGSGFPVSPRMDHSPAFSSTSTSNSSGQSKTVVAPSTAGGLHPYTKAQRASSTRRVPSSESSLYDPYRSRQPGVSANRVKNDYQAQSPHTTTLPQQPLPYYSGHGSSEDVHDIPPHLADDPAFPLAPPSIAHREDHYRQSPTLTASQTLAASYSARPESPFQAYLPYQPYSNQQALPSPSIIDAYRSSSSYSSPGLGPLHTGHAYEERTEQKADPYRSAFSQSAHNQTNSQWSGNGSPNPNDDFSSSFESRFSGLTNQQHQHNSGNNNTTRYPMRDLAGQESSQALSNSFYEPGNPPKRAPTVSSETAASCVAPTLSEKDKDKDTLTTLGNKAQINSLQQSYTSQPSKTEFSGTKKPRTEEEEEDEVILQKLGVISTDSGASRSGGTRSGTTYGSGRSRRKGQWTDESEEESQDRSRRRRRVGPGEMESQRRRRMRGRREDDRQRRCCCCITRTCACIAFGLLVCLAVTLYFLIPRTPAFMFESVSATGPPVVTRDRIREPFAIQLMVDSKSNYLPLRLSVIDIIVQLKLNQTKIADNNNLPSSSVIQPRTAQVISIPMNLDYKSLRIDLSSDAVLQKLFEVCTPIDPNTDTVIPGINLVISGNMHVWGLSWVWKPSFSLNVDNVPCPVNARAPASETPSASSVLPVPSATVIMASLTGNSEDPMAITAVDEHDQTLSPVAIATATAHG